MAKTGPKPKPVADKIARGKPGHHPLNLDEPKYAKGVPEPPDSLKPEARAEWDRIVPELVRTGVLAFVHRSTLVVYCQRYADFCETYEALAPGVTEAENQRRRRDSGNAVRLLAAELGITPSSQSRIVIPKSKKEEDLDDFVGRKPKLKIAKEA